MALGAALQKKLSKKFEPGVMLDMQFKGYDLSFKTDDEGNAILLFIGTRNEDGHIKGERYARTLKTDREGHIIKDHWDLKGKAT
jgi:hypothetical protein